jgi:hypothetical protein
MHKNEKGIEKKEMAAILKHHRTKKLRQSKKEKKKEEKMSFRKPMWKSEKIPEAKPKVTRTFRMIAEYKKK